MIRDLRVDDRLIHGQIALTWPRALGINRIIVANDAASTDKTQQMSLKMAVPSHVKVLIRSIADTITFFDNEKARAADLMIIVNSVTDAQELASNLADIIERINIANVGRFDGIEKAKKIAVGSSILLSDQEQKALNSILTISENVVHQIIPDNSPKKIAEMINEK